MIIPTIDLMNDVAVQLKQGKTKILEEKNIQKLISKFEIFPETNVIDLDAAMNKGNNRNLIKKICKDLRCNVGGGIRTKEIAYEYLRAGAKNIIIGTNARIDFLKELPINRTIVALDIKKGKIAVEGWKKTLNYNFIKKIKELENYCSGFLITNIDVEGKNQGTNIEFIKKLRGITRKRIIVAGGISNYEEIELINKMNFDLVLGTSIYTNKINLYEAFIQTLDFSKGLIPTIVKNNQILMLAYSNKESILKSIKQKKGIYYSRSRKEIWEKGKTSGNIQKLKMIEYDCDADSLIYTIEQTGNACHTGKYSCFGNKIFDLDYLLKFLEQRLINKNKDSYTYKISQNEEKLQKKIMEEAFEITKAETKAERIWEISDLIYFITIYMAKHNVDFNDILNELSLRHKNEI